MESSKKYHAAYDEDFKKSIVTLHQNGRTLFFASEISPLLQNFFPRHRWGIFM